MPDHFLESGDSPDLEALFDQVASSRQAPPVAAPPVADSGNGDSPDLQALFDEVSASCQQQPVAAATPAAVPPAAPGQLTETGDSPELQSLFEQVAADYHIPPEAIGQITETIGQAEQMYSRVGQLTRKLHDALHELGYDKSLERAASAIPDAKDRLSYIATLTENAAERALNATDRAQPHVTALEQQADELAGQWQRAVNNQLSVDEFRTLALQSRDYFTRVPAQTQKVSAELMEIVMAQDFQDLTGQVIKKVVDMVQIMEHELLTFLMEYQPEVRIEAEPGLLENGPVVNPTGRTDVVTNQQQVDDLLASLGF
ncbi:CheZ [Laribacter hongkongensis HLHK9]|uniref:Protein phosphatase CheZ n=1 Tax=Laribacter hongkongensis (strain HLHK9) TaxID=557598 RepID=C1DCD1_LARHH|nr:protein phosphatase CheZ [Laribacter hongkongensis]ACO73548.1 CheZ [Laribacter hongkongensis HLHK9]